MKRNHQVPGIETADLAYAWLYRIGSVAALVAALIFRRNLDAEWMLLRATGLIHAGSFVPPGTVVDWFVLLQQNQLLGLTLLNLFDLVNYALVGMVFLALFAALRRASPPWMLIAAALAFSGITAYFASNQAFTMLSLSKGYAVATTDVQRASLLAAGEAVLAIHNNASFAGSGLCLSFLLISLAGLIISAAMLKSSLFSKGSAYFGMLANAFGLGYYLILPFVPALVFIPLSISAIFLLMWYILVGRRLWALGSQRAARSLNPADSGELGISRNASQPM